MHFLKNCDSLMQGWTATTKQRKKTKYKKKKYKKIKVYRKSV